MDLSQLAASEQQLWDAFPRGEWIDFRDGNPSGDAQRLDKQREIRAEVVRALLLGACVGEPGYTQAVRLRGARIVGPLDLTGAVIGSALVCEFCYFEDVIVLCDATSKSVRIEDSRFPGLDGTRLRAEGILSLRGSVVTGIVRLNQANVIGQVSLRRTAITPDAGEVAASAEGLTVEGYLDWEDLKANGLVDLSGARISGSASFNGACILRPREADRQRCAHPGGDSVAQRPHQRESSALGCRFVKSGRSSLERRRGGHQGRHVLRQRI
jgi:hypothetical protein